MNMNTITLKDEITETYQSHPGYKHWFWSWMARGEFSTLTLQRFALFYYEHVKRFRSYLFRVASIVPNENMERALAEIIADEHGLTGSPAHPKMFRNFMRSMGLSEENWNQNYLIKGVEHFRDEHFKLFHEDRLVESLGAVIFALEGATPYRHSHVARGIEIFNRREGTKVDATFFTSHVEIDPYHQQILLEPIESWLQDEQMVIRISKGIEISFDARKVLLDDLAARLGLTSP